MTRLKKITYDTDTYPSLTLVQLLRWKLESLSPTGKNRSLQPASTEAERKEARKRNTSVAMENCTGRDEARAGRGGSQQVEDKRYVSGRNETGGGQSRGKEANED